MTYKKIFLTGATGFLGSHIAAKLLNAGYDVHALCRKLPATNLPIHWHIGDLKNPLSIESAISLALPEVMIHCAAYGIRHHEDSSEELIKINIEGTLALMNLSAKYGIQRWIQAGSCFEYPSQEAPISESTAPAPRNLYGFTKVASTLLSIQQALHFSMPVCVLRLFSVYGPGEWPERLIPTLISACILKKKTPLTSGDKHRDFIYVEEVADLFVSLVNTANFPDGEILNVGLGIPISLRYVGQLIEQMIGKSGLFLWGEKTERPLEYSCLVAETKKIRNLLHWTPKISLERGLRKTIQVITEDTCKTIPLTQRKIIPSVL